MANSKLKVGDRVTGTNLNGKNISGEIVIIPRLDLSIAHVKTEDPNQTIHFAKIDKLQRSESATTKKEPAKTA